jgi:serine/threonine-protein kinase
LCDRFESAWLAGERPRLEDFLPLVEEADRPALLRELLAIELDYRGRQGERPTAEEYRLRLPTYAAILDEALGHFATSPAAPPRSPRPETPPPPRDKPISTRLTGPSLRPAAKEPPPSESAVADQPLSLGAERYLIEGEIARGGMGAVLRAHDRDLNRALALKVLREDFRALPEMVRRFHEEAQITGQLQHPAIPPVHEIGTLADGRPFLAMKLIRGRTLAELLKERSSPAQDRSRFLKIFEQVCQAVAYAHSKDVVHRDLKPGNIMVGAFGEVQVMDWGLAKVLASGGREPPGKEPGGSYSPLAVSSVVKVSRTDSGSAETQEGAVLGTPAYMPPEQALGEVNRLDQRCDVFSLGSFLCEILTTRPPYTGGDRMAVLRRARRVELADALERLEACEADEELVELTRRCLSVQPEGRPRDAGAVAGAEEAYLAGVEERARQAELKRAAAEAREAAEKKQAEEAQARAVEAERRTAAERRARRLTLGLAATVLLFIVAGGSGAWLVQQQRADAAAKQREADQQAGRALDTARTLLAEGWKDNDTSKLAAALAEVERAVQLARDPNAGEDIRDEAAALLEEARAEAEQARKNAALLTALLDISAPRETKRYERTQSGLAAPIVEPSMEEQFAAAFRRWGAGLDLDRAAPEEVHKRLASQPRSVQEGVVAGLEAWMLHRRQRGATAEQWQRLLQLANQLDENEMRREVRALLGSGQLQREHMVGELSKVLLPWSALRGPMVAEGQQRLVQLAQAVNPAREPVLSVLSLAQALSEAGDTAWAERLLKLALAARPDQVIVLGALGKLLAEQRRWQEAIGCYRAARAVRPDLGVALASVFRVIGEVGEAEAILRELTARDSDNPELHFYYGIALRDQKKLAEAVAAYQKAIDLKPDLTEAYVNLGNALCVQKKLAEAVAAYHKAIDRKPDYAEAYNNLGVALRDQKKLDEAVAAYQKAIALQPDLALAYYNLGNGLREQKQLTEAVVAFRKAIALQPDYSPAYHNLGLALRQQKKLAEAVTAFRKADQLLPNHPIIRNNLRVTEQWLELDRRLPALLAGKAKPRNPQQQIELALFCSTYKEHYQAAVRFFTDAFRAEPKLADNLNAQHRYNAACATALAAAGKGQDAGKLDDKERARLRQQALDWLRADLAAYTRQTEKGNPNTRQAIQQRLAHWQEDTDLAAVRDAKALAALPEKERAAWQKLWADVAALRKKVEGKQ